MIDKKIKIVIIGLSMIPLILIGWWGMENVNNNSQYSMRELIIKYPTVIDLKYGVDSGQLDYDKLPHDAKKALDKYDGKFLEGLK